MDIETETADDVEDSAGGRQTAKSAAGNVNVDVGGASTAKLENDEVVSTDNSTLLVLASSNIGDGEPDLGEKLMRGFLSQLLEVGRVPAKIICMSSGIFLTTQGSPVVDLMCRFEELGSEILSCGTCLDYYERRDKLAVGVPTNMRATVDAMLSYDKVLRP